MPRRKASTPSSTFLHQYPALTVGLSLALFLLIIAVYLSFESRDIALSARANLPDAPLPIYDETSGFEVTY